MALIVYKALNGTAPVYISELCVRETLTDRQRTLRSAHTSAENRLVVPRRDGFANYLDRAFSVAGPLQWNCLSQELRCLESVDAFRRGLKTHFFGRYYV